jgi:hypothetical protein
LHPPFVFEALPNAFGFHIPRELGRLASTSFFSTV